MGNGSPTDGAVLIYATFPTLADAERVGGDLLDRELVACANIFPGVTSIYNWDGKRQRGSEVAMILKSREALAERVVAHIKAMHPYANPAILVLPVLGGSSDFLAWVMAQTSSAPASRDAT